MEYIRAKLSPFSPKSICWHSRDKKHLSIVHHIAAWHHVHCIVHTQVYYHALAAAGAYSMITYDSLVPLVMLGDDIHKGCSKNDCDESCIVTHLPIPALEKLIPVAIPMVPTVWSSERFCCRSRSVTTVSAGSTSHRAFPTTEMQLKTLIGPMRWTMHRPRSWKESQTTCMLHHLVYGCILDEKARLTEQQGQL